MNFAKPGPQVPGPLRKGAAVDRVTVSGSADTVMVDGTRAARLGRRLHSLIAEVPSRHDLA